MLEKSELKKEMENAINWIKGYVEKTGANGVVIGNSRWKRFCNCSCYGS